MAGTWTSGSELNFIDSDDEVITKWYRFDVNGNGNQKVVTHTFYYNGKTLRNYSLLYDKTKKAALWVAYAMNNDTYPHNVTRSDNWSYDPALDQSWQPKLSKSYSPIKYERGHQVASNDRRTTRYQMYQTDYFSNMTPQRAEFNSGDDTEWDNLEERVQNLGYNSVSGGDTLYVVTGPIFGDGYTSGATDNNGAACPVPTQYYKCIMKVHFSGGTAQSATGAAFLFDHESGASRQDMTIDDLETLTGFDFFANIPSGIQETAESKFTTFF